MKRKDFARKKSASTPFFKRWRWPLVCMVLFLLVGGMGYSFLHYPSTASRFSWLSSSFSRLENWIAERKQHLQKGMGRDGSTTKTKAVANNKATAPQPIHFEFYTALPDMRVTVPDVVVQTKTVSLPSTLKPAPASKPATPATVKSVAVVSAEELEQEFSKQLKQSSYVLQLGVFRQVAMAERYHHTVKAAGLTAEMVKLSQGQRSVYRVQLGPFLTKEDAKLAQRQAQKKGINGLVLKEEASS